MRLPTLRSANYLCLTTLLTLWLLQVLLSRRLGTWGLVIAELAGILIPLAVILARRHLPPAEILGLRWPGLRAVLLAGLGGLGTVSLAILVDYLLSPWMNTDLLPTTGLPAWGSGVARVTLLVLAAPLAEEPLYRGYVYNAYRRRSPKAAILVTAVLFLLFHLRLTAPLTLMALAVALSYVRWRSDSLYPCIAMHAIHNSAIFLLPLTLKAAGPLVTRPAEIGVLAVAAVIGGLAFWLFIRTTSVPASATAAEESPGLPPILTAETVARVDAILQAEAAGQDPEVAAAAVVAPAPLPAVTLRPAPLRTYILPMLILGAIWAWVAVQQASTFRTALEMRPTLTFTGQQSWNEVRHWTYEIQNPKGIKVGQADCRLTPDADTVLLACHSTGRSDTPGSILEDGLPRNLQVVYRRNNLQLLTLGRNAEGKPLAEVIANGYPDYISVNYTPSSGAPSFMRLRPDGLVAGEWPFRLSALSWGTPFTTTVDLAMPGADQQLPGQNKLPLTVTRGKRLTLGGKEYDTWTVALGKNERAIYDAASNHTLLRYDNGVDTYLLTAGN